MIQLHPAIIIARIANGYLVVPFREGRFAPIALPTRRATVRFISQLLADLPLHSECEENNPFAKQLKDMAKGLKIPEDWVRDAFKEHALGISPFRNPDDDPEGE